MVQIEYKSNKYQIKLKIVLYMLCTIITFIPYLFAPSSIDCVFENRLKGKTSHVGAMPKTHEYEHETNIFVLSAKKCNLMVYYCPHIVNI